MQMIFEVLGYPNDQELKSFSGSQSFDIFQQQKVSKMSKGESLEQIFYGFNPLAIDLLKKLLTLNPEKRITVTDALAHEYFAALHCEDDEPVRAEPVSAFDFDFEIYQLKKQDYIDLIFEEIMLYHSDDALKQYMTDKKKYPEGKLGERYKLQNKTN